MRIIVVTLIMLLIGCNQEVELLNKIVAETLESTRSAIDKIENEVERSINNEEWDEIEKYIRESLENDKEVFKKLREHETEKGDVIKQNEGKEGIPNWSNLKSKLEACIRAKSMFIISYKEDLKCFKKDIAFSESQGESASIKERYKSRFKERTLKGIESIKKIV